MNSLKERAKQWLFNNISLHQHDVRKEELANGLTHLFGAVLSVTALILLVIRAVSCGSDPVMTAGVTIYGLTMVLLYTSSSLYHLAKGPVIKRVCRILDHGSIYILIAGTYTPVMLYLGGKPGWAVFGAVWALTVFGLFFTLYFWGRYGILHVLFYIAMGWMVVVIWRPLLEVLSSDFIKLGLAGGVTYTAGTLVYAMKKVPYYHAVWHMFVVGGSLFFFIAIYSHLLC